MAPTESIAARVRCSIGRPASNRYCLGSVSPLALARSPRPAATTIAAMVLVSVMVVRRSQSARFLRGPEALASGSDSGKSGPKAMRRQLKEAVALPEVLAIVQAYSTFEQIRCILG